VDDSQIRIVESYQDYRPPFDAAKVVRRLLRTVPQKYLLGLDCVVLVNDASLPRKDRVGKTRSRKRKVDKSHILGRYHPEWRGKRPWIEIRVDRRISTFHPRAFLWFPLGRAICLGTVLYHELGHHVHDFIRPEYKEKEDVADDWSTRFLANFLRKQYWYVMWPIVLFGRIRRHISPPKVRVT
jgi:hypothetical protein